MGHRGRDDDPLDCLVCVSEPTFPGCVIAVKPIALFKMEDEKGDGRQDRLRSQPRPGWNHAETLEDVPEQLQREITHFFSIYKQLEGKEVKVDGWRSREEALEVIEDAKRLQEEYDRERRRPRANSARLPRARAAVRRADVTPTGGNPQVQDRGLAAYIAELVGTMLLVFAICTVVTLYVATAANAQTGSDFAVVGLVHGIVLFMLIATLGGVSGGHFNPAVTLAAAIIAADRPDRRGRLHPRPALGRRARRADGQGLPPRRGPRRPLRRRRRSARCSAATSPAA